MLGGENQVTEPEQGLGDFYRLWLALVTSLQTNLPAQAGRPGIATRDLHIQQPPLPPPMGWQLMGPAPQRPPWPHPGLGRPGPGHLSLGTWLLSPAAAPLWLRASPPPLQLLSHPLPPSPSRLSPDPSSPLPSLAPALTSDPPTPALPVNPALTPQPTYSPSCPPTVPVTPDPSAPSVLPQPHPQSHNC